MRLNSERHLLILTCTVNPQVSANLVRTNPKRRLEDYVTSISKLQKYSKNLDIHFIVAENSNSIGNIELGLKNRGIDLKKFTFISCPVDNLSKNSGISAGEHEILRQIATSTSVDSYEVVWKLTGRLSVENLGKLIACSSGDVRANRFFAQAHTIDSRFFGMSSKVFKEFALNPPIYSENRKGISLIHSDRSFRAIEFYLAYFALMLESEGLSVRGLSGIPEYSGTSASSGKQLDGLKTRFKVKTLNKFRWFFIKGLLGVAS